MKDINEETPVNCASGGNIASIGVGLQGEPPAKTSKVLKRKSFKQFVKGKWDASYFIDSLEFFNEIL